MLAMYELLIIRPQVFQYYINYFFMPTCTWDALIAIFAHYALFIFAILNKS